MKTLLIKTQVIIIIIVGLFEALFILLQRPEIFNNCGLLSCLYDKLEGGLCPEEK